MKNTLSYLLSCLIVCLFVTILILFGYLINYTISNHFQKMHDQQEENYDQGFKTIGDCSFYTNHDVYQGGGSPFTYIEYDKIPPVCKPIHDEKLRRDRINSEAETKTLDKCMADFQKGGDLQCSSLNLP